VRVLFISWRDLANSQAGGSEILVDQLARGLQGAGHEVALLAGGPVRSSDYPIVDSGGTFSQYARVPFAARRFRDWDLVVDVSNGIPYFSPLWRRGPILCLVHHVHREQWRIRFPKPVAGLGWLLERRVVPFVYRHRLFLAISASTAAELPSLGIAPEHIRRVTVGVDVFDTSAPRSREPLFLVLGRLVAHKRVELALRVWERVRPRVGGRLLIAGDGPDRDRLEALAGEDVEFLGRVSEEQKARLLASSWLLVHPAAREGWGIVIMEAAVAGTPALGFDVPGVRDAVANNVTGRLVQTEEQLAEVWSEVAKDAQQRDALGARARERAQRLSWAATVEQFLGVATEAIIHDRASARR
jgi:glycosyltransferase involved in cell wall biosynthesis